MEEYFGENFWWPPDLTDSCQATNHQSISIRNKKQIIGGQREKRREKKVLVWTIRSTISTIQVLRPSCIGRRCWAKGVDCSIQFNSIGRSSALTSIIALEFPHATWTRLLRWTTKKKRDLFKVFWFFLFSKLLPLCNHHDNCATHGRRGKKLRPKGKENQLLSLHLFRFKCYRRSR